MTQFDPACRRCPRLADYLDESARTYPGYHSAPVAPFGDPAARLLIVGLAPGLHGANATGRPFTGDYAGVMLYDTLYRFGLSSQPTGERPDDGLTLKNCRITNAVKCVPPANKPIAAEIRQCNDFLAGELELLSEDSVIIALGRIAHDATLRALNCRRAAYPFAHAAVHEIGSRRLVDSYHCSRYNTNTRRLTAEMFDEVFRIATELLDRRAA